MSERENTNNLADCLDFTCCTHCLCGTPEGIWPERMGHDDTCRFGCNDEEVVW